MQLSIATNRKAMGLSGEVIILPRSYCMPRFAITLEWLDGVAENSAKWNALLVPAALSATHRMVFRDKSEDQWKVQPINLSLYTTVLSPD